MHCSTLVFPALFSELLLSKIRISFANWRHATPWPLVSMLVVAKLQCADGKKDRVRISSTLPADSLMRVSKL